MVTELKALNDSRVRLYAIGVGATVNRSMIIEVSSPPHTINENYWIFPDIAAVRKAC